MVSGLPDQDSFVAKLKKKHGLAALQEVAKGEGIMVDDTLTKEKLAILIYRKLVEKAEQAVTNERLEGIEEETDAVIESRPALKQVDIETHEELNPVKKPSSYAVLKANAKKYGGIAARTIRDDNLIIVTGMGQKWSFPLEA